MHAISLFSGAGGLDLGCEAAGFRTVAAVEADATARSTMLANAAAHFPELQEGAVFGDIVSLDAKELLHAAGQAAGETALLHGGPPPN